MVHLKISMRKSIDMVFLIFTIFCVCVFYQICVYINCRERIKTRIPHKKKVVFERRSIPDIDEKMQLVNESAAINNQNYIEKIDQVLKDLEDKDFALELFRKVMLNYKSLQKEYENKTPNWDMERIALMDIILLNMAIAEFLYFSSIPIKVTINEYLEIAKEYSTPNSAIFINGVLDQLVKTEENKTRYRKVGRGLM